MGIKKTWLCAATAMGIVVAHLGGAASAASPAAPAADVRLEAGSLRMALLALAKQTGVQIIFTSQLVQGRSAPAVSGRLTPEQAVNQLIAGSDLEARWAAERVLVVRPRGFQPAAAKRESLEDAMQSASGDVVASEPTTTPADPTVHVEEVVIGSHIRGVTDVASPVIVLSRDRLERDGRATVADALSALPQAFGGTAGDATTATGTDGSGTNTTRASTINLRGLGADATLVLVNGRRLAGTGMKGDFADLSSIPMSAVDRIEVLLDGASALYGSDAVGGVVNIVLRRTFEGSETRVFAGGATRGDATQVQLGQTLGRTWDSGSGIFVSEPRIAKSPAIPTCDRSAAATEGRPTARRATSCG